MRAFLAAVVAAVTLHGQPLFQNLSPTGSGSAVYFSSALRLKGSDQYAHEKIFIWEQDRGVRLFAERSPEFTVSAAYGASSTEPYRLVAASAASANTLVALIGLTDCSLGTPCATTMSRYFTDLQPGDARMPGTGSLSPSGRFLLLDSPAYLPPFEREHTLIDLATRARSTFQSLGRPPYRHGVADDGTVVIRDREKTATLMRMLSGESRQITDTFTEAKINAAGNLVFFRGGQEQTITLTVFDARTGAKRDLAQLSSFFPVNFDISDDGSVAAYELFKELWTVRTSDSFRQRIATVPEGIAEVAMSGDGTNVFVVTGSSRILRFNLRTLVSEEIVAAPPDISYPIEFRGARTLMRGGLYEVRTLQGGPLPVSHVRFLRRILPLVSKTESSVAFQIPYDFPLGSDRLGLVLSGQTGSVFEGAINAGPFSVVTNSFSTWIGYLHEDFSGPVTAETPARPWEIIHAYATGLGPVSPEPAYGVPASATPLSLLADPIQCAVNDTAAAVLFAGLAPGFIGLYQVDIRMPNTGPVVESYVDCRTEHVTTRALIHVAR